MLLASLILFLGTGWYVYQSTRIFNKGNDLIGKNRPQVGLVAYQALLHNFPLSPLSSAARIRLVNDQDLHRALAGGSGSAREQKTELIRELKLTGPDPFVWGGLGFLLTLGILAQFQRQAGWTGSRIGGFVKRCIFIAIAGGGYFYLPNTIDGSENLKTNELTALNTIAFFIVCLWAILASLFFLVGFRKMNAAALPAEEKSKEVSKPAVNTGSTVGQASPAVSASPPSLPGSSQKVEPAVWRISKNGIDLGEMDLPKIKLLILNKELGPDDLFFDSRQEEWMPLSTHPRVHARTE